VKGEGSFGCFSCCTSSCCGNNVEFEILSVETGEAVSWKSDHSQVLCCEFGCLMTQMHGENQLKKQTYTKICMAI